MDFSALADIQERTDALQDKVSKRFSTAYYNALEGVARLNEIRAEEPFAQLPMSQLEGTVQELHQAIASKPSAPEPHALLSYLFFLMGNLELAVKYLKKTHLLAPDWPKVQELRALYLEYVYTLETAHKHRSEPQVNTQIEALTNGFELVDI